jgi:hypothetical protein
MDAASTAGDAARFFQSARVALQQKLAASWHVAPASITIAEIDARLNGEGGEIRRVFALADQAAYSGQHLSTADFKQWKEIVREQIQTHGGLMTLFQILTRKLATGKIKATRKLLNRLRRETGGKRPSKPPKARRRKTSWLRPVLLRRSWRMDAAGLPRDRTGSNSRATEKATATSSGYSAAALFNQANAYARAGKPGLAVLNYERAQLLAPNDADIAANLHFVRAKAGLPDARRTGSPAV